MIQRFLHWPSKPQEIGQMSTQEFDAALERRGESGSWICLSIPFDVPAVFGSRARIPVQGTINGYAFRTSIFPEGDGSFMMMVNRSMQAGASAHEGDVVRVRLERDDAPRPVEVPAALASALASHPDARRQFEQMSPSHRRTYAEWVGSAKAEETRQRRAEKAVALIADGKPYKM